MTVGNETDLLLQAVKLWRWVSSANGTLIRRRLQGRYKRSMHPPHIKMKRPKRSRKPSHRMNIVPYQRKGQKPPASWRKVRYRIALKHKEEWSLTWAPSSECAFAAIEGCRQEIAIGTTLVDRDMARAATLSAYVRETVTSLCPFLCCAATHTNAFV